MTIGDTAWKEPALKTMLCLLLDRSGSMAGKEGDVLGGVNTFITKQQQMDAPATIAMVRFDSISIERFRAMGNLKECKLLEREEYVPRDLTPLNDAIGRTLVQLDEDWKQVRPERCIVMIVTDGHENASFEYTKPQVKAMIQAREASGKWAFIYLGANVDAFAEATSYGINLSNTAGFTPTASGIRTAYAVMDSAVHTMRSTGSTIASNMGQANLGEGEDDPTVIGNTVTGNPPPVQLSVTAPIVKPTEPWVPPDTAPGGGSPPVWQPPT
jgi:uncharacterized protein YegL